MWSLHDDCTLCEHLMYGGVKRRGFELRRQVLDDPPVLGELVHLCLEGQGERGQLVVLDQVETSLHQRV